MLKICVMGLGYVGLPTCLELSKKYKTTGFDINKSRVANLRKNIDLNNELKKYNFFLFLSKGEKFKFIANSINKKKIIDPFLYYSN